MSDRAITRPSAAQEDLEMNIDDSPCTPTFLDENDDIPAELPLMVTRHTLRSLGLSLETLKQFDSGPDQKDKSEAETC